MGIIIRRHDQSEAYGKPRTALHRDNEQQPAIKLKADADILNQIKLLPNRSIANGNNLHQRFVKMAYFNMLTCTLPI